MYSQPLQFPQVHELALLQRLDRVSGEVELRKGSGHPAEAVGGQGEELVASQTPTRRIGRKIYVVRQKKLSKVGPLTVSAVFATLPANLRPARKANCRRGPCGRNRVGRAGLQQLHFTLTYSSSTFGRERKRPAGRTSIWLELRSLEKRKEEVIIVRRILDSFPDTQNLIKVYNAIPFVYGNHCVRMR